MIAMRPERASCPPSETVDPTRKRARKSLHAFGERALVVGLDDKVKVIVLQAELDHAKPGPRLDSANTSASAAAGGQIA